MRTAAERIVTAILALTASFLASSCDTYPADNALGVTLASDGGIIMQYVSCQNELVHSVQLFLNKNDDPFIGNKGDELLWGIASEAGSPVDTFIVGDTPAGFTEVTAFSSSLSAGEPLGILLNTTKVEAGSRFRVSDLKPDRIFTAGESLDPLTFKTKAQARCG
jgi:hypothetical protein